MLVLAINSGRPPIVFTSGSASAAFADVAKESAYYPYVQNALSQNLIDIGDGTFNPNGKVDREEMAELIARALGYNSLAEHDNLFNVTFRDAAETKQKGQAAIAVGLGIMTLSGGKFQPAREVTRAEAASAFSRFLSVRAELQEAPLRNG
nr:S-layer homology domain-containing protein [Cohnella sp. CFH 77786]